MPLLELFSKKKVLDVFWKHLFVQSSITPLMCIPAAFLCQARRYQSRAFFMRSICQSHLPTAPKDTQGTLHRFLQGSAALKTETSVLLLPEESTLLVLPCVIFAEDWSRSTENYHQSLNTLVLSAFTRKAHRNKELSNQIFSITETRQLPATKSYLKLSDSL